jgi:outer membrane lipoprotein
MLFCACARPPAPIDIAPLTPVSVAEAQRGDLSGVVVRWGGTIVSATVSSETCFEIVSRPLDAAARPLLTDETDGRFIACIKGFYDPTIYAPGRQLTVVGTLAKSTMGKIGEREYNFPKVAADALFLWPERRQPQVVYYPVWFGGPPYPYVWWGAWPYWRW